MIGKIFGFLDKILSFFEDWTLFIAVMIALMALFFNVVLRYGFNYTLAWSEELVREVIIYTTLIGCSAAIKQRKMIKIDASVQLLPKLKVPLNFFSNLVTLIFAYMMIYYGWLMAALQVPDPSKDHYHADSPGLSLRHAALDGYPDVYPNPAGHLPGCDGIENAKILRRAPEWKPATLSSFRFCWVAWQPIFPCSCVSFSRRHSDFVLFTDLPLLLLAQTLFRSMDNFALVVVLFFILCGNIMTAGSIVEKLIKVANALVSWLPGGLGMAGVLACGLFGAISGSTVATVVALGGFMIPALIKHGYPEKYTIGLMTTSPNLGVIIPPSIGMILFSMISNVSLEGLFLTGFSAGCSDYVRCVCLYLSLVPQDGPKLRACRFQTLKRPWLS